MSLQRVLFTLQENLDKKVHPAIKYFLDLEKLPPSNALKQFSADFDQPRSLNAKTFREGVQKFIELANSHPLQQRESFYGNRFLGLHYNNDLMKLWNASNSQSVQAHQVSSLVPKGWDSVSQDEGMVLVYRGDQPAEALDALIKGPVCIDCGMFAQLSMWFGIRYVLGNKRFNELFGRAPFFITQFNYNQIISSDKPYSGNPLFAFLSTKEEVFQPAVTVKYLSNTPDYKIKHPGGNYSGDNCIVSNDQYSIFDPLVESTQKLSELDVLNLLRDAYNAPRQQYDEDRLSIYAKKTDETHPVLMLPYGRLIELANYFKDHQLTEDEFHEVAQNQQAQFTFDLAKFDNWLKMIEKQSQNKTADFVPTIIHAKQLPAELIKAIPFENKYSMDFSKFKQDTEQQKEMLVIAKAFCQSVMSTESTLVVLTGKAGVGKTASAVCAAKELAARGKKVVWISEVVMNGWSEQAKSMEELAKTGLEIDKLLSSKPDAIFLDDDNLTGYSGRLLLEKIYMWYVTHPGKGLYITSNEPIRFEHCYGLKIDGKYTYPPFCDYASSQYLNRQYKTDLNGLSLRSRKEGQSVGAMVSDDEWKKNQDRLKDVELIPALDDSDEMAPIRRSLKATGKPGEVYDKLRPIQQKWIDVYQKDIDHKNGMLIHVKPYLWANPTFFEKTDCKTIAIELGEWKEYKEISPNSMDQLIRVLNYAHDQGGRRVMLINQTRFTNDQLLQQIKSQLPEAERERTWSRLQLLLCENEQSIFGLDEFNRRVNSDSKMIKSDESKMNELSTQRIKKPRYDGLFERELEDKVDREPILDLATQEYKITNKKAFYG